RDDDLTHHDISSICRLKHRVLFIVGEFRPLMVRKRAALLRRYNVSGESLRLTRSLGSSPAELVFAAGGCRGEERSQQRATIGRDKECDGNTQITNASVSDL